MVNVWRCGRQQQDIEGAWHGGQVSFGYHAENHTLGIDPGAVELVCEAARRVLAGESPERFAEPSRTTTILT